MRKEVDIEKLGMALEDLEDIKDKVGGLIAVPLIDLKKEIKKVVKELNVTIEEIDHEIGAAYTEIIERR